MQTKEWLITVTSTLIIPDIAKTSSDNCLISSQALLLFHYFSDIDECTTGTHNCSDHAVCNNTKGGHNCTCKKGFIGDGENCTGKVLLLPL